MLCLVLGLLNRSCGKWRGDLLPYLCLQVWWNRVRIIFWLKLNLIELQYYLSEAFCFVARRYSWFALHKFIIFIFLLSYLDSSLSPLGSYFPLPYSFHQTKPWRFIDGPFPPFLSSAPNNVPKQGNLLWNTLSFFFFWKYWYYESWIRWSN